MEKAIVSDPAKAFGQNMLQDKPHKVVAFEGTVERFTGTGLDVLKGDLAVLMGDDVVLTDDTPVEVARQIQIGRAHV